MVLKYFLFGSAFLFASCTLVNGETPSDYSSSAAVSSSSAVVPSSSSVVLSSSSAAVYSSSVTPSSSSSVCTASNNTDTHYCSNGKMKQYGSVPYEGQTYKAVEIGTQTWMARNLNYAVSGSECGDGSSLSEVNTSTCDTYGRLYDWATANTVCPSGWHLPSDAEWTTLTNFVGDSAWTKLKATNGWNKNGNGSDVYGFAALPGGYGYSDGRFSDVGDYGCWWSSTEDSAALAWYRYMGRYGADVYRYYDHKSVLYSVRCVKD